MTERATAGRWGPPPRLVGYTYPPEQAYRARDQRRLLAIRLETNRSCNLSCRYCYAESDGSLRDITGAEALIDVIDQACELGAESIVVIGGGEPTLHPRFADLIAHIDRRGATPVVFTNCLTVDDELARFLYDHNASVMGKLDSLRSSVQDYLTGRPGSARQMRTGLNRLMAAGFCKVDDPRRLRLGVSFVSCRLNLGEIEDIWRFCRDRNIFPNMEVLTPTGRAAFELADQGLTTEEIQDYKLRLLEIDRAGYGFDWLPHTPLSASGCLQHLYSLYITMEGAVRPCAPTKFDQHPDLAPGGVYPHTIFRRSLRDIYDDPLFEYVRTIDTRLEGKCGRCEHLDQCIGCRGYAYAVGVRAGLDPYAALRSPCRQCAK